MADTQEKKACPCCGKHTDRSEEERRKLINRLKRVEGQIRGIIGMLENDAYCNDILIQSAAVNAAVNAFNKELLANHIRTCVARDIREGKDETIDELVTTQKLERLIAAAPNIGFNVHPKIGIHTPAASGIPITL